MELRATAAQATATPTMGQAGIDVNETMARAARPRPVRKARARRRSFRIQREERLSGVWLTGTSGVSRGDEEHDSRAYRSSAIPALSIRKAWGFGSGVVGTEWGILARCASSS